MLTELRPAFYHECLFIQCSKPGLNLAAYARIIGKYKPVCLPKLWRFLQGFVTQIKLLIPCQDHTLAGDIIFFKIAVNGNIRERFPLQYLFPAFRAHGCVIGPYICILE